jgi:glucosamine--fructose-6-phosphate aminotransferase (isomerizing)
VQEVAARGGRIVLIGDEEAKAELATELAGAVLLKRMASDFSAIVYAVPVQLLAYHAAVFMGKDVDQPRNLAKSVTVE